MPLSEKRLAANRANALKSTGPKTEHGKRMSAQNGSYRTRLANVVLLTNESRENFFNLSKSFEDMFRPEDPFEQSLLENMIVARWRTIRLWNLESANLNHALARRNETGIGANKNYPTMAALAMQDLPDDGRTQASRREYHRAAEQLAVTARQNASPGAAKKILRGRTQLSPAKSRKIPVNPNPINPIRNPFHGFGSPANGFDAPPLYRYPTVPNSDPPGMMRAPASVTLVKTKSRAMSPRFSLSPSLCQIITGQLCCVDR